MKFMMMLFAVLPTLAWASPFDGTWVTKMDTVKITGTPDSYLVAKGMFSCDACTPPFKIKADGADHKVTGHDYYDSVSARVLDANRVEMSSHAGGKPWAERTFTVSSDGNTMTEEFVSYEGTKPSKGKFAYTRVAPAPAGAHMLSGSWQTNPAGSDLSSDFLTMTMAATADGIKMTSPLGQGYDAKFDGKEVPMAGDTGKTMVSLKKMGPRTIRETDTRGGKVTDIFTFKVASDGKTLHAVDEDKQHGTTMSFTADKK